MTHSDFLIGAEALRAHLNDPLWRIVDCRFELSQPRKGHEDYRDGHIPGAVYAHLDHDLAGPVTPSTGRHPLPHPGIFKATLGQWGISRDTSVVVYDQSSGAIAARLWWMLHHWLGHESVVMLDGGFEAWQGAGLGIETKLPTIVPTTYRGEPDNRLIVTTEDLQRSWAPQAELLVDARDAERFAGITEPIDAVAGHIPGARNFPFKNSLNADGTWRREQELEAAWSAALGDDRQMSWITMCGSGVTACHLAVSAQMAGFRAPRLYAGSWSEWIRDPSRPITGPHDSEASPAGGLWRK